MSKQHPALVLAASALAAAACAPNLGEPVIAASKQAVSPPKVAIEHAQVGADRKVVVTYQLSAGDAAIAGDAAAALRPTFTLAALSTDPVSGVAAWKSHLLTGRQTIAALPISGPGTPPENVLANTKQPGADVGGAAEDLGGGAHRYTFGVALPEGYDATETLRVGLWLAGVAAGTTDTNATFDFVPGGGPPQARDTVLDANCAVCHGAPKSAHGTQVGVRICLTCHTYQNADPDTVDPAAMTGAPGSATKDTNPNPLDLGRLVHRIHRGKRLPTLHNSSSTAPAPPLGAGATLPLPYLNGRNTHILGAKYSIITDQGREFTPGKIVSRADNGAPARTMAWGFHFPRDLRDCKVCHGGAPQEGVVNTVATRRVCQGCHTDVWFGEGGTDATHLAHPGGPKPDDAHCNACHVAGPYVRVNIADAHVPPFLHANYSPITAEIVSVTLVGAGQRPVVKFRLSDRNGPIASFASPTPPTDAVSGFPRKISLVNVAVSGSMERDYANGNNPRFEQMFPAPGNTPSDFTADEAGLFTYQFQRALPADASGIWAVSLDARRNVATTHYDPSTDTFRWPYSGETVTEIADNPVVYVDSGVGAGPDGTLSLRRPIVDATTKCNRCHGRLTMHGARIKTQFCVLCHTPDRTDWNSRPKVAWTDGSGLSDVNLAATYDNIEERSVHFKVMIHRIHTGARKGSSQIDVNTPLVMYFGVTPLFFDDRVFPNDTANCTLCHLEKSYEIEAVPPDSPPTIANETATIQHAGGRDHAAGEPRIPPLTASCIGCHDTGTARVHTAKYSAGGVETCVTCHGAKGGLSVRAAHKLPAN